MTAALAMVLAYVVGGVPLGYLVARAYGIGDLRAHGSGNIGATNVLRTAGRTPAIITLVGDVAKGYLAAALGGWVAGSEAGAAACALAAVIGNCFSPFLRFHGGKGVATGLGAMLRIVPWAVVPATVVWLALAVTFRIVSLASIAAAIGVPFAALVFRYPAPSVGAAAAVVVLIVARHHANIARLLAGTEPRVGERHRTA